jgi:hypothetical protein
MAVMQLITQMKFIVGYFHKRGGPRGVYLFVNHDRVDGILILILRKTVYLVLTYL